KPVGAVGGALHHLLELLVVELEHVRMRRCRLGECGAQAAHECVAPALGDPLGGVLERVVHSAASAPSSVLIRVRNAAARRPYTIRWSHVSVSVITSPGTISPLRTTGTRRGAPAARAA